MGTPSEKPVYFVSSRPEAYELWGEIGHEEARRLGTLIAERAAKHFPNIEFKVDDGWHVHSPGMELVAAYIDGHWQSWANAAAKASSKATGT